MVFALMVIPCIMLVGFAVDMSRVVAVKNQTQGILDNAALAGTKAAKMASTNIDTVAQDAATAYWNAHKAQVANAITDSSAVTLLVEHRQDRVHLDSDAVGADAVPLRRHAALDQVASVGRAVAVLGQRLAVPEAGRHLEDPHQGRRQQPEHRGVDDAGRHRLDERHEVG